MPIDLRQFHAAFFEESFEAVDSMEAALLRLTAGAADPEAVNTVFRVAHSIKGGAATFGFAQITSLTHSLENLLEQLRAQRMLMSSSLSDLLLRSVDVLRAMLRAQQAEQPMDVQRITDLQFDLELAVAQNGVGAESAVGAVLARALTTPTQPACWRIGFTPMPHMLGRGNDPLRMFRELRALGELAVQADTSALPPFEQLQPESCHLAWQLRLSGAMTGEAIREVFDWAEGDCVLELQAPETPAAELAMPAAAAPVTAPVVQAGSIEAAHAADVGSLRVSVGKIDDLMNSVSELVITQSMLGQFATAAPGAAGERLRAGLAQLERNVRELQESVMRVRMVPISFVFSRFPRMVRDLGQRLGKLVELQLSGGDTEVDKTVLEKIGDPLVHLIRNSIDHGIELPQQRRELGKAECGRVHLHAYHRGSNITVEASDDGAGLNRERILAKARKLGLIREGLALSDQEIDNLIFLPGFSTVEEATEVSGRGVGMDVVRRNIESLGGSVEVCSQSGRGARFTITLPLTLAIIDGQTVAVGAECYIVPLTAIVESLQVTREQIGQVVGHGEVVAFRGAYLPVVRLAELFGVAGSSARSGAGGLLMIVEGEGRRAALLVDELLGQQQVVVKTLDTNYGNVEGIAGATILGTGSVALILDVGSLARRHAEVRAA